MPKGIDWPPPPPRPGLTSREKFAWMKKKCERYHYVISVPWRVKTNPHKMEQMVENHIAYVPFREERRRYFLFETEKDRNIACRRIRQTHPDARIVLPTLW